MLDGMAKVDMLAAEVKRQGMPAVGITDHGNMFGSDAFYQKMVAEGIKPIIGIEAYLAPESRFNKNRIRWGEPHQKSDDVSASGAYLHQTMIAETATGLQNLFYLSSMASYEGQLGKWPILLRRTPLGLSLPRGVRRGMCKRVCVWGSLMRRWKPQRCGRTFTARKITSWS